MRTQTLDVPRQEAITRDNSPVTADAVVYIKVMDAKKAFLEVDDYKKAVSNLAQTTLRAVLGDMELDDTLNKRQEINSKIREELDEPQGDAISTVLRAKSSESMGERAVIERGMETLESIGEGESTTFVLPQELTSLLGRYGRQLTNSDVQEEAGLESLDFDDETRELLGLDDIERILGQIDEAAEMDLEELEQEAEAIKAGETNDIKDADQITAEKTEEMQDGEEVRKAIVGYVSSTPGVHFSKIRDELKLGTGETQHHLRRLVDDGRLTIHRDGDYKRFYLSGRFNTFEQVALGFLRRTTPRGILIELLKDPTATGADLATVLDVSQATVSTYSSKLDDAGLISRTDDYTIKEPEIILTLILRHADSLGPDAVAIADEAETLLKYSPQD